MPESTLRRRRARTAALLIGGVGAGGWALMASRASTQEGLLVPTPVVDEAAGPAASEVAVLAGGCFWGVQGVFQNVEGVTRAVQGNAGDNASTAVYEKVGTGRTGQAEPAQITSVFPDRSAIGVAV